MRIITRGTSCIDKNNVKLQAPRSTRFSELPTKYLWARVAVILTSMMLTGAAAWAWEVDFSRRVKEIEKTEDKHRKMVSELRNKRKPASESSLSGLASSFLTSGQPKTDIVILNTKQGFVPSQVHLREGQGYQIHVVNINDLNKNVSFVLNGFSEYHSTYFGERKSFSLIAQKEGVYAFQCPETASQGQVVVYPAKQVQIRRPAMMIPSKSDEGVESELPAQPIGAPK